MYALAKFQLCILNTFEGTALQSSSNRKIDFNYRRLPKTDVTYEWSDVQTQTLHHRICNELRKDFGVSYSFYSPLLLQTKWKSVKNSDCKQLL